MRITTSSQYWDDERCPLMDCERFYCPEHRFLYRTCESVTDYADDGKWYTGECPICKRQFEMKEAERKWKAYESCLCEHGFNKLVAPPDFGACSQCYPERKTA